MGFGGKILSDKAHYEEFVCSICCQLVDLDDSILTRCNHVFCLSCMRKWLERQRICPICKNDLSLVTTSALPYLKYGSPLAWRVLSKVQIECPLKCGWKGDYYRLQSHLTSSSNHVSETPTSKRDFAKAIKEQANEKFEKGNYKDALQLYTRAISNCDNMPELYSNRAAVYLKLQEYDGALMDANSAIKLDKNAEKAWYRGAKAYIGLGKFEEGIEWISQVNISSLESVKEELRKLDTLYKSARQKIQKKQFHEARNDCLMLLQHSSAFEILKMACTCETECGSVERSLKLAIQVVRSSSRDPGAYVCMAIANLYTGQIDEAVKFIKEALRLDPDSEDAKQSFKRIKMFQNGLNDGEKATASKQYENAITIYSELLEHLKDKRVPLKAKTLAERANAYFRQGQHQQALKGELPSVFCLIASTIFLHCAAAIYVQDDCKRAWLTKNYVLHAQGKHEEALKDMEQLMNSWGANDNVIRGAYEKSQFLSRKAKRPDYYKILSSPEHELSSLSSEPEIKAAYKNKALKCHPDKLSAKATVEERKKAEAYFKLCGEALEILTSEFKRKLYDEGFDKEAIEERLKRAQTHNSRDPH